MLKKTYLYLTTLPKNHFCDKDCKDQWLPSEFLGGIIVPLPLVIEKRFTAGLLLSLLCHHRPCWQVENSAFSKPVGFGHFKKIMA